MILSPFKGSWNLSRLPFVFWQYRGEVTVQKRGFVFILAGFQSLLYFCTPRSIILYPLFCGPSFISRALLFSHSLFFPLGVSHSLPLLHRDFFSSSIFPFFSFPFSSFHLGLYSNSNAGCWEHISSQHIPLRSPITCLVQNHPPYSSCHPSSPSPPLPSSLLSSPPLYPTGLEIVPLFLTSVLLGD